jgi:primosomal protein N' (replication factor Y)
MTDSVNQDISPDRKGRFPIVGVAFPIAIPGLYDYRIPHALRETIRPGTPVLVDLRGRKTWGVAVEFRDASAHDALKEIVAARTEHWTDANASLIKLYKWMAGYYQCDLGRVFRPLVSKGISGTGSKTVTAYRAAPGPGKTLSPAQRDAWRALLSLDCALTVAELRERCGVTPAVLAALRRKKMLLPEKRTVVRESFEQGIDVQRERVVLTEEQQRVVEAVSNRLGNPDKPFLLHGITGSGKTHVYTALAARTLAQGRTAIVLVPEIALTPQTIMRFRAAVGDVVAVIHSHMSDGERRDALQELVTGGRRMLIGVRSAILAPMDDVGLIIVDEEHDTSYKQTDVEPRYHARDIAIMRGHFQKAVVVLGSATPSLESYFNAQNGKYHLERLTQRFGPARLPAVRIVDMNEERRNHNWTVLSRLLEERMAQTLASGRQIILLLNRRGYSVTLLCKECGFSHQCPNCSVTLRYHLNDCTLKCHLCGYESAAPDICPVCHGEQLKYKGTGIQKAEELIAAKFPDARILRMDHDTTRRKGAHHLLLDAFAKQKADILLGTQMVAKGLDFPGVALVGVLQADTGLLFPDFRASERTFQLLTQVAGRAGRSDNAGEVVIQTCYPQDPAISCSGTHDFEGFYRTELPHRQALKYPPAARLARLVMEGPHDTLVRMEMEKIGAAIAALKTDVTVLGPSPAVLFKVKEVYRYSLLLKARSSQQLTTVLSHLRQREKGLPKKMKLIIDVDPVQML